METKNIPTNHDAIYAVIRIIIALFDSLDDGITEPRYILRRLENSLNEISSEGERIAVQQIITSISMMLDGKSETKNDLPTLN